MLNYLCLWMVLLISPYNYANTPGQKAFINYCAPCHSLAYKNPPLKSAMRVEDASRWFGLMPPDLSLVTLKYSKAWISQYLLGFYDDPNHHFGRNNTLLPNVQMPDILGQEPNKEMIAKDIADYLDLVAMPEKPIRQKLGILVLLACIVVIILTWLLKKNL